MFARSFLNAAAVLASTASLAYASEQLIELPTAVDGAHWQSLSTAAPEVIWIGSHTGHVARSDDAGHNWTVTRPAGSNASPIMQIKAIDERQAYVLTSGAGSDSRLYHTRNGGYSWNRVYRANGSERLRCFDLIANGEGWILGDELNNNWHVVRTTNGRRWLDSRSGFNRPIQPGESAYSASASCLRYANDTWVMATAFANPARIAVKTTSGLRFNVVDTPVSGAIPAVTAIFPMAPDDILLTGGDLDDTAAEPVIYRWRDQRFETLISPPLSGTLTNLLVFNEVLIVSNPNGTAWTEDMGASWQAIDLPALQISCQEENGCYGLSNSGIHQFLVP